MRSISTSTHLLLLAVLVVATIILDTSIIKLYIFDFTDRSSELYNSIFATIVFCFSVIQYVIMLFTKRRIYENIFAQKKRLIVTHTIVSVVLYIQIAVTIAALIDIRTNGRYSIYSLYIVSWTSYLLSIFLLGSLIWKFFLWFKSHHNVVVLVYLAAVTMLSVNSVFTLLYVTDSLESDPVKLTAVRDPIVEFNGSSNALIVSGYSVTNLLSFFITWAGTVLILQTFSNRIGRIKYWVMVSIPLVYFIGQFQSSFVDIFSDFRITQPFLFGIIFTLIFSSTNPIGGILFGIAFWTMGRRISKNAVKNYMFISAVGITLLFATNHSCLSISNAPYPPFGLASVWLFGLGSYLFFIGIYSTALSVTQDSELRQTIRKSVERQSQLIDSIGSSEMEYQIRKNVVNISRKIPSEDQNQSSLEEEDIRQYIHEVIKELSKDKKPE